MSDPLPREVVLLSLQQVLESSTFSAAPKMSDFLRYIVTQTLNGNSTRIKAYSIAVDALGKPASFDPQLDPSVRVMAYRLRKSLAEFYELSAHHDVEIRMHPGGYVPTFIAVANSAQPLDS